MKSPSATPLFAARLVLVWLAAAALICAASFYLLSRDSATRDHSRGETGATVYSRSALGYDVLFHTLQTLGIPTRVENYSGSAKAGDIVVILEPTTDQATMQHVAHVMNTSPATILVLPKRRGIADPMRPGKLVSDELIPTADVGKILALSDDRATVARYVAPATWAAQPPLHAEPLIRDPQLVQSATLIPLLSAGGILVGESANKRLLLVADPDILENHALGKGNNASIAIDAINILRGEHGAVVFDAWEKGHAAVAQPVDIARLLFEFPFVLVTLQLAIATALLFWCAGVRFGNPKELPPAFTFGKENLIQSGSQLMQAAGKSEFIAEHYTSAILRDTANRIHAPSGTSQETLIAWFAQTGRPVPELDLSSSDESQAVATANALYHWRQGLLHES